MNDRIVEAIYVEKTHANSVDTFKADEQGSVGMLLSDKAFYYHAAAKPTFKKVYDVSKVAALPRVDLFMGYQGADLDLFNASIAKGSKGIVIAGESFVANVTFLLCFMSAPSVLTRRPLSLPSYRHWFRLHFRHWYRQRERHR
jgi:hypothetical protein